MENLSFEEIAALTEEEARAYLERIRWPDGPGCPRCGDTSVHLMQGKSTRPGVYKCRGCRKPFTVTIGTIFERSHISLRKWLMAFALVCGAKKGISALQLQRHLNLKSYKTAWFMAHRIRYAMRQEPLASMLKGTIEADETYIGGKPRRPQKGGHGRYRDYKTPIMALVERGGDVRALALERVTTESVRDAIEEHVDKSGRLMTDEANVYVKVGREFAGGHHTTKHSLGEYLRDGDIHSNTAESFFSLVKRGVAGAFHHVSKAHLPRYLDEFAFRWNGRKVTDSERTVAALRAAEGKRLTYYRARGGM